MPEVNPLQNLADHANANRRFVSVTVAISRQMKPSDELKFQKNKKARCNGKKR